MLNTYTSVYHTNMDRLSTTPTRSLIRHAILSQTGTPRWEDAWPVYGSISVKCFSQRQCNCSVQEPN